MTESESEKKKGRSPVVKGRPAGEAMRARIIAAIAHLERTRPGLPSLREVAEFVGVGASLVRYHLLTLRARGDVTWEPRQARSLRLVPIAERVSHRDAPQAQAAEAEGVA